MSGLESEKDIYGEKSVYAASPADAVDQVDTLSKDTVSARVIS